MAVSSKKILKLIGCLAVLFAIIGIVLVALSALFTPKDNTEEAGMYDARAHGILGEPADSIDVVFVGDSEVYNGYSPLRMWEQYGFTTYLCSTNAQKLPYANTILHRATSKQHPAIVLIETNEIYNEIGANDIAKRMLQDTLPVFEYHDRWKTLRLEDFYEPVSYTWTSDTKGYELNKDSTPAEEGLGMEDNGKPGEVGRLNRICLEWMLDYVRSIGAVPVLVSTPSIVNWNSERHDAIAALAQEEGVDYIDLNFEPTKVDIDWQADTRDRGDHLNFHGATKASDALGRYLSETYDLPDHRGDPAYASWDECLREYIEAAANLE